MAVYRAPSMDMLQHIVALNDEERKIIRKLIHGERNPRSYAKTDMWVRSCYSEPSWIEKVMSAIDEVLGNFGVESLWHKGELKMLYCNTGESYQATIVYRYDRDSFAVASWGDAVEVEEWDGQQ